MPTVEVIVVSSETRSERKLDLHMTIEQLKNKLEPITGVSTSSQKITLHASEEDNTPLAVLDDDSRPLGYYSVQDRQTLKVEDTDPISASKAGQYTDVSQVEKFEMSNQEYESRRDTVLSYKKQHNMGRFAASSESKEEQEQDASEVANAIPLGSRCEVDTGDVGLKKRGAVRFVGPTKFAPKGIWVGVEYDEPLGRNDGSVQGERYFTCRPSYGAFVRPDKVNVGDYPAVDPFEEEEEI